MPRETSLTGVKEKRTSERNQQISGRELYSKLNILILKFSSMPIAGHFWECVRPSLSTNLTDHPLLANRKKSRILGYQGVLWISRIALSFSLRTSRQERT
jgi:hypothetical protein